MLGQAGDYEGLQVQAPDGTWAPVPIVPGALQVLSGTLLTRWTGGRLRPGRHRVIAGGADTRRSTAVFCYPSLDTVVAPLPRFAAPAPTTPGSWSGITSSGAWRTTSTSRAAKQVKAWREGRAYVAPLAEISPGRG